MEQQITQNLFGGIGEFLRLINWIYLLIFIISMWLINDFGESTNKAKWLTWFAKIHKGLRTFIMGIILIPIIGYFFRFNTREDYFAMFASLILGMVVWKLGVNAFFEWLRKKIGIKKQGE